ncbi:MAG TPA: HD domain-containing phosphohydrolase, partial [Geothrix sp.]|nr:HD domain-containing phosphohydrolase [Geothrix sp.]
DPGTFSLGQEAQSRCAAVARQLGCKDTWEIEIGALLAPIGRIALPQSILAGQGPGRDALQLLDMAPEVGARLVGRIPRMEAVADIIRYHRRGFDGSGIPLDGPVGTAIPLGARILKAVWDFSAIEAARRSRAVALEEIRLHAGAYDPEILKVLLDEFRQATSAAPPVRHVQIRDLRRGMVLVDDVRTPQGLQVLARGLRLGTGHIEFLTNLAELLDVQERVAVRGE